MTSAQPYQGTECKVFQGMVLVVIRTSGTAGAIQLAATAPALGPGSVQIRAREGRRGDQNGNPGQYRRQRGKEHSG